MEGSGLDPRKKPNPGSSTRRSGRMPATFERRDPRVKERFDPLPDRGGISIGAGGLARTVGGVDHDELAVRRCQVLIDAGIGKAANVVETRGALRECEPLRVGLMAVDRDRNAELVEPSDDRREPMDLFFGRDSRGVGMARGRTKFHEVGPVICEIAGVLDRRSRLEVKAPIGKRVLCDVDDADDLGTLKPV